jgi:hypothetical protein
MFDIGPVCADPLVRNADCAAILSGVNRVS